MKKHCKQLLITAGIAALTTSLLAVVENIPLNQVAKMPAGGSCHGPIAKDAPKCLTGAQGKPDDYKEDITGKDWSKWCSGKAADNPDRAGAVRWICNTAGQVSQKDSATLDSGTDTAGYTNTVLCKTPASYLRCTNTQRPSGNILTWKVHKPFNSSLYPKPCGEYSKYTPNGNECPKPPKK
jgi:hypothetical protein